jgi:hypothetical protein
MFELDKLLNRIEKAEVSTYRSVTIELMLTDRWGQLVL